MTPLATLQTILDESVARGIPGISATIANSEGLIWQSTAGLADLANARPIVANTLFGIGSITKTFVAVVVLQLIEEGKLERNAVLSDILGAAVHGVPYAKIATIASLLNHTSGIPSWEDSPRWIRDGRGVDLDVDRRWEKNDTLSYLHDLTPVAASGEKYHYSNSNYTLLGLIIEQATGAEAASEIRRRILKPLGLRDTFFEGYESLPSERVARRYHWATKEFRRSAGVSAHFPEVREDLIDVSVSNLSVEWTAGGMVSSTADLAKYGVALRDGHLLNHDSMEFMTTWRRTAPDKEVGHNLIRRSHLIRKKTIGHDGAVLGFTGSLYWIEDTGIVVAILCNAGAMHAGVVARSRCLLGRSERFIAAAADCGVCLR